MKIKDLFEINKAITTSREYFDDNIGISCIHYGDIYRYYNEKTVLSSKILNKFTLDIDKNKILNQDSIIMPDVTETISDFGHLTYIKYDNIKYINGTHTLTILNNKNNNLKYLFYYLQSSKIRKQLQSLLLGSTVFQLSKKDLENFELKGIHNKDEQQHIVDTVGSLDDKIENNNKIIERLIIWKANNYKNALSNISCQEYNLLDMVDFIGGTQPPKSEHIYDYKQGYIRFIQNRDYSSENHLTYIKESTKNKLCNEYDIMMDKYGEAGKVRFGISGAYNVALAKIDPKNIAYQEWIREFLNTQEIQQFLFNSSIASTRASVSENNLMNIKIPVPSKDYIAKFEEKHKIIIKFILKLKQENKQLEKLKKLYLSYYF